MINGGLKSFVTRDVELAKRVVTSDSVVDGLYDQVFRELITFMMVDPRTIDRATRLIWAAHNLERVADRATNICERVVFTVTGKMEETAGLEARVLGLLVQWVSQPLAALLFRPCQQPSAIGNTGSTESGIVQIGRSQCRRTGRALEGVIFRYV